MLFHFTFIADRSKHFMSLEHLRIYKFTQQHSFKRETRNKKEFRLVIKTTESDRTRSESKVPFELNNIYQFE